MSPFEMEVSFVRRPHVSRYKKLNGGLFAWLINYLLYNLRFKIDRADLRFGQYKVWNMSGTPDRLVDQLLGKYTSRMKFKVVSILAALRIQDCRSDSHDAGVDAPGRGTPAQIERV